MARGRRTAGWIVIPIVLLLAIWGLYRLFILLAVEPASRLLLPALSLALAFVVLALAGVLVRNLVRLIVERKRGIFGARLRTKLVFFILAMVLFPSTILFYFSATVIKQTVEAILRTPLEDLVRQSDEIVRQWNDYLRGQAVTEVRGIAGVIVDDQLLGDQRKAELQATLDRWRTENALQIVRVTRGEVVVASAGADQTGDLGQELERLMAALSDEVLRAGAPRSRIDHLGQGLLAHAAIPLAGPPGAEGASTESVVAVGTVLPSLLAGNLEGFAAAAQTYRQFRAQRRDLVRLYLTLIGLVYLVTLFIATWIGFYVSRRITEPIQDVASAAREISAGNLGVRVRTDVGDEVGTLVVAFNEMVAELEESRAVITRSTADLRRSNRALDERRRYIETLLANLSTAVVSLDTAGRVTTVNPAVREILGVDLAHGDDPLIVFRSHDLEQLAEVVETATAGGGEESRRDLTLKREDGTQHLAVHIAPLESAGDRAGTLVMVEDLADLVRAQRAAAWREVARRIAHEIKNPLTPIQLAAQRLRKKFAEGASDLNQVLPEATASIEREVGTLKRLVDEFSRFARMPEISPRVVQFDEVVESVLALYKGLPAIRWEVDVDERIGRVLLDPEQMRRVLINLIDNGMAAMSGEGTISIRAEAVGGGMLRLELSDTGPGIPAGDRDRMFIPYFSTKPRGTGLGLAIVHKVVTDHRGTIRVEDAEPHGARFVIELPA